MNNVYGFPSDNGACGHYRVIRPLSRIGEQMGVDAVRTMMIPDPAVWEKLQPQLLLTQRQTNAASVNAWQRTKTATPSVPFVMDYDDLIWMPHPRSSYSITREMIDASDTVTRISDIITTSTEPLKEELERRFRRPVRVVPNLLRRAELSPVRRMQLDERPRFLWAGSSTHAPDLDQLIPAVLQTVGEVDWFFMGMVPNRLRGVVTEVPPVSIGHFHNALRDIGCHVGVAPLVDDRFNRCKSNLKLLDYGAAGMATIASNVDPYRDSGALLVRTNARTRDWVSAIRELSRPEVQNEYAQKAADYAARYVIEDTDEQFLTSYLRP